MALDADVIVDRRRLRRKLAFWRVVGFIALAAVLIGGVLYATNAGDVVGRHRAHIARITVSGLITDNRRQQKMIKKIAKSDAVKGVIVSINSPGGTTTGGEALYEALRELGEKKPVVAHIGTLGASAGYMIALASDHIVARRSALTGSIGVIIQFGEVSKLLDTVGIKMDSVKSAPLKAEPNFYTPTSPDARRVLEDVVGDSYDWFVGMVSERRKLTLAEARRLGDGRIYTGAQAHKNGLVDAIGGEKVAVAWLETEHKITEDLPLRDWKPEKPINDLSFSSAVVRNLIAVIGETVLSGISGGLGYHRDAVALDGLLSVWQAHAPDKENLAEGAAQ